MFSPLQCLHIELIAIIFWRKIFIRISVAFIKQEFCQKSIFLVCQVSQCQRYGMREKERERERETENRCYTTSAILSTFKHIYASILEIISNIVLDYCQCVCVCDIVKYKARNCDHHYYWQGKVSFAFSSLFQSQVSPKYLSHICYYA